MSLRQQQVQPVGRLSPLVLLLMQWLMQLLMQGSLVNRLWRSWQPWMASLALCLEPDEQPEAS